MPEYAALAIFGFSLLVFFLSIGLTLILGGVSRAADKLAEREGRVSTDQRLPTPAETDGRAYHY
jgi:predicted phage tail protein